MVQEEPEEEEATLIIRPVKVDAQISLDERCGSGGSGQPFPDGFRGKPKKKTSGTKGPFGERRLRKESWMRGSEEDAMGSFRHLPAPSYIGVLRACVLVFVEVVLFQGNQKKRPLLEPPYSVCETIHTMWYA